MGCDRNPDGCREIKKRRLRKEMMGA